MKIIGLTGGIASGKSTVASELEKLGASVLDADQIAREVVSPGEPAYNAIVETFGTDILNQDRTINRTALGVIVFSDENARKVLEAITHPEIRKRAELKIEQLRGSGAEIVIYMAPLLIEAGAVGLVDEIWVVYVDAETQLRRILARDRISKEEALKRIAAQMPMDVKATYGKFVIDNRGALADTISLVRDIWASLVDDVSK